jgi:hypothetical protein
MVVTAALPTFLYLAARRSNPSHVLSGTTKISFPTTALYWTLYNKRRGVDSRNSQSCVSVQASPKLSI